jgi:NTE family protein
LFKLTRKTTRIGLALGGGGARGLSHIGVLKVLEAHGVKVDVIAGTSIGALVGATYALDPQAALVEEKAAAFLASPSYEQSGLELFKKKKAAENFFGQVATFVKERLVINLAPSRPSLVGGWRLAKVAEYMLGGKTFAELKLPFACVATDLDTGEEVIYQTGSLPQAVQASMSIPGFLPPVYYRGRRLVDGAVRSPVPVQACRNLGADFVIAVDVSQSLNGVTETENVIDIIFRANTITNIVLTNALVQSAEIAIRPKVGHVHWAEFRDLKTLVAEGERAAQSAMPGLQRALEKRGSRWQRWLKR